MKKAEPAHRPQVVLAAAWRIASELMRRHCDKFRLRVLDVRRPGEPPGLGIFQDAGRFPGTPFCRIDLAPGGSVWTGSKSKVVSRIDRYVDMLLSSEDPSILARKIESSLGLPEYKGRFLPATTPPVLMYRLLAGLTERFALSRELLEPRCGWVEMAGEGSHALEELMLFPDIAGGIGGEIAGGGNRALAASGYWLLFHVPAPDKPRRLAMLFGLDGGIIRPGNPPARSDAASEYDKAGREILHLVNSLEESIRR